MSADSKSNRIVQAGAAAAATVAVALFAALTSGSFTPPTYAAEQGGSCSDCGGSAGHGGAGRGSGMGITHPGRRGTQHSISRGHRGEAEGHSGSSLENKVIHGGGMGEEGGDIIGGGHQTSEHEHH